MTESRILTELEADLTDELEEFRDEAMTQAAQLLHRDPATFSIHSFHAIIGRWNNELLDCVRMQFSDPDDFFARWLAGLRREVDNEIAKQEEKYGQFLYANKAIVRLLRLMQNKTVRDYAQIFLTRNFYRNLTARTRAKPDDSLWSVWFGNNQFTYGLLIAPVYRNDEWTNDKSEIRRADYDYWTVGHVLETGIVDPDDTELYEFTDLKALLRFYRSVLKKVSNSIYEKAIADEYVNYVRKSDDPLAEPFLIPEVRYAGLESKHKYRMDFSVLNSHVMSFTGFEFSPVSTHMALTGTKKKTQKQINADIAEKWEKEMNKRNKYFTKFGISTVTFTDSELKDIGGCFAVIKEYISQRSSKPMHISDQVEAIEAVEIPGDFESE